MIVISNTSPINYLILIELDHLLPALFGSVMIPTAVKQELDAPGAPERVRRIVRASAWLHERSVVNNSDPRLATLGAGEREAISLAHELKADLVLLDEAHGRRSAAALGLSISGTLGIIDKAAAAGLTNRSDAVARLRKTTFRAAPALLHSLGYRPK